MARDDPQMKLRLPEDLRDRIAEAAKANNRSMNAEIVARLEGTFAPQGETMLAALSEVLRALAHRPPEEAAELLLKVRNSGFLPPLFSPARSVGPEDEVRGGDEAPGPPAPPRDD